MNPFPLSSAMAFALSALLLPSCRQEAPRPVEETRAPRLTEQAAKNTPVHPEILALAEDINQGRDNYDAIRHRLFALPRELSSRDADALLDLLLTPPGEDWPELRWAALFNDGLNILRQGEHPPARFIERLLECHADKTRPAVLRDYALQHFGSQLAAWYRAPDYRSNTLLPDASLKQKIEKALEEALSPENGATMGTACNVADDILAACGRSGRTPPFTLDRLSAVCRDIVRDPGGNLHARLTALGFLGRHDNPSVLDDARRWRDDASQPVLLRAAAINYTGRFKKEEDRAALTALGAETDLRLSHPARQALKNNFPSPPQTDPSEKQS